MFIELKELYVAGEAVQEAREIEGAVQVAGRAVYVAEEPLEIAGESIHVVEGAVAVGGGALRDGGTVKVAIDDVQVAKEVNQVAR
jgi:hypothetical protein